jgi:Carboxypeptidase regulatory-like domain
MNKQRPIQINIPQPCSQSWEEMKPCDNGRFCAHCRKTVIDFTTWSDAALFDFFAKNRERVCGRFCDTQLNREIRLPYQPHSRLYRMAVALGLTVLIAQAPAAIAQRRPPLVTCADSAGTATTPQPGATGNISGIELDEHKEPLINAAVQVYQNGILRGGSITDFDGKYTVHGLDNGEYDVVVLYIGYDSLKATNCIVSGGDTKADFAMTRNNVHVLGNTGAVTVSYKVPLVSHYDQTKTTYTREQIERMMR